MSVRHTLLGLLASEPRYGYELRASFMALAGGSQNWEVKPAQIYTTLNRLVEAGLITRSMPDGADADEKVVFQIAPAGQQELEKWLGEGSLSDPQQDPFFLKLMLSLELPDLVTTLRGDLDPRSELARILLMDKAIMHLEADLRWLDMIEARLDEVKKQPVPRPELRPRGRPAGK
jgi:DNA-binding PadR family transcriptional regulator